MKAVLTFQTRYPQFYGGIQVLPKAKCLINIELEDGRKIKRYCIIGQIIRIYDGKGIYEYQIEEVLI